MLLPLFRNTFWTALIELILLFLSNLCVFFVLWFIVWPNKKYNDIFNNGIGIFHGYQCDHQNGYYIYMAGFTVCVWVHILSLMYLLFDYYYEKTGVLQDYKVKYPKGRPKQRSISWSLYRKSIFLSTINHLLSFIYMPTLFVPLMELRGNCQLFVDYTSILSLLFQIIVLLFRFIWTFISADIIFYVTHRSCHEITFLYKNVHKWHHEYVNCYAISHAAAHPLEHLVINLGAIFVAPIVAGMPVLATWVWLFFGWMSSTVAHSGYGHPLKSQKIGNAIPHDFHHKYQDCEYGIGGSGLCEKIFKTQLKDIHPNRWKQILNAYKKTPI